MLKAIRRWFEYNGMVKELDRAKAAEQAEAERAELASRKALQQKVIQVLAEGKVPDVNTSSPVPFKLQRNERLVFVQDRVGYSEIRVRRQVVGRSSGMSVRVMKGVSVRSGESLGTPVETDVETSRGSGLFAISTKHVFFNGQRSFRIPLGKIVSAQKAPQGYPEGVVEIVRDRASSLPEYFGIHRWDADFVVSLIHILPSVDFGTGEPQIQHVDNYFDNYLLLRDLGDDGLICAENC